MRTRARAAVLVALVVLAAAPAPLAAQPDVHPGNAEAAHRCREEHAPGRERGQCISAAAHRLHLHRSLPAAVAELLGISVGDLRRELRGRSLVMVAQAHGVSRDRLRAFLIATVQLELTAAVNRGELSAEGAAQALNRFLSRLDTLIDRVHPAQGHGQGRGRR